MISFKFLLLLLFGLIHHGFCQYESAFSGIYNNPEFRGGFSEIDTDDDIIPDSLPTQHNGNGGGGIYFHENFHNIFDSNPFFSTFGGFGFGQQRQPWWKGPNVCTETEEKDESESTESSDDTDLEVNPSDIFNSFQFTVNSCVEKPNKYVCKRINNKGNKKTAISVTKQCCHGFSRPRTNDVTAACEKLDVKSFTETAEEFGSKEFMRSVGKNDLKEKFDDNITLFMPTDEAFTDFSEQMFENNLIIIPGRSKRATKDTTGITTKDLILSHVVDGRIYMEDLENEDLLKTNFENSTIRINIFAKRANRRNGQSQLTYTANCAPILKMNKQTTNGVLNIIEQVLVPTTDNLMDIIRSRSDMTVLRTILEKTNLAKELEKKNPTTMFAPTDSAFEKLDSHMKKVLKEGGACASNILKNHILKFTLCGTAIVPRSTVYNLLGESLNFTKAEKQTESKSEQADLVAMDDVLINGQVRITEKDIMGSNGVLHVIDSIMPTESSLPITTLMKMKNITVFRNLIEAAGLTDEFDQLDNVTFFAPTDKSLAKSVWKRMLDENDKTLANSQELKDFLKYHISTPVTKTCDLSEKMVETLLPNNDLRVNLFSTHAMFSNVLNRATVNCARLVHFDDESCGTVLHQVDKALIPPTASILEELENNPQYSNFYSLVKKTNVSEILSKTSESFTVLVPKNDVFEEFDEFSQDQKAVENLVKTHIVNDVVCCAGIIPTSWPFVRTIETLSSHRLRISRDRRPKIENAGVTKCDIIATNGIIHEINDVIVPKKKTNWPVHETLF